LASGSELELLTNHCDTLQVRSLSAPAYRDTNTSVYVVPVGSATASLLSTVTAVSQKLKHSELDRIFKVVIKSMCDEG